MPRRPDLEAIDAARVDEEPVRTSRHVFGCKNNTREFVTPSTGNIMIH